MKFLAIMVAEKSLKPWSRCHLRAPKSEMKEKPQSILFLNPRTLGGLLGDCGMFWAGKPLNPALPRAHGSCLPVSDQRGQLMPFSAATPFPFNLPQREAAEQLVRRRKGGDNREQRRLPHSSSKRAYRLFGVTLGQGDRSP